MVRSLPLDEKVKAASLLLILFSADRCCVLLVSSVDNSNPPARSVIDSVFHLIGSIGFVIEQLEIPIQGEREEKKTNKGDFGIQKKYAGTVADSSQYERRAIGRV